MEDNLKTMIVELEDKKGKAQKIFTDYKDKKIEAETKSTLDGYLTRITELRASIDEINDREAKMKDLADTDAFLNNPKYKVPHGSNGDDDSKKMFTKAGWDVRNGEVYAPTSIKGPNGNNEIKMFSEDVLFGPLPDNDPISAKYIQTIRASFEPSYAEAFKQHSKLCVRVGESKAYTMLDGPAQKALQEGIDSAGGFLVPPDLQSEVLVRLAMKAIMRQLCRVVTTSRDLVRFPRVQPNGTSGSIYSSGFVGDWAGETPAFTDVDPAFGTFEITIKKARAATKLSLDFVNDSSVNIMAFMSSDGGQNLALVEDNGFIVGLGDALHPMGILAAANGVSTIDVAGTTAHVISNSSSDLGSAKKIMTLQATVPTQYQPGASWLMHRLNNNNIRQLTDFQGRFLWAAGFDSKQTNLLGKDVYESDFVSVDGVANNRVLVYGDFSAYIAAQRAQITITILRERFADTDQVGIILTERIGGNVWNTDAFRIGYVS